jgi:ABC-type branched-subunit amino acid transport system ATPase component
MSALLEARQINVGYNAAPVVRNVSLHVNPGEVVAMLGANGAGKTTTIRTLAGELRCMAGDVCLYGEPTTAPLHRRARAGLGLVSEERAVLMQLTVAENLRVNRGDSEYALELFPELKAHLDRRVGMLSGGQQQMLALARALSRRPKILLADELSLGLAPIVVDRLLESVRKAADGGIGVLLVEQHIHKALAIADRVYVLRRGEVQLEGLASEMRARSDDITDLYLAK